MKLTKKKRFALLVLFLTLLTTSILTGCVNQTEHTNPASSSISNQTTNIPPDISKSATSTLKVHFLDVGQADCMLIQNQGHNMLIDAGNYADYSTISNYLNKYKIKKIEHFVLTHPHEDHIGSAAKIIEHYTVQNVYMTKATAQSKIYKSLINILKQKKIKPLYPKAGDNFFIGETAFTFLGPVAKYNDVNSMSLVVRADFGSNSFLFTGDCTDEAERDMLNEKVNLHSQVLKVGHHGSRDSSTYVFLKAVNPKYSVISTEIGNDYGHPHKESLSRLHDVGTTLFRTDKSGTIIATSNGKKITWNTVGTKSSKKHVRKGNGLASNGAEIQYSQNYIGNKNSKVFHRTNCSSLPIKKNQVRFSTRQKAIDAGYHACGRCNP